jgi:hypothetical protein
MTRAALPQGAGDAGRFVDAPGKSDHRQAKRLGAPPDLGRHLTIGSVKIDPTLGREDASRHSL